MPAKLRPAAPFVPNSEISWCPVCGVEVARVLQNDRRPLAVRYAWIEKAFLDHLDGAHPIRYWLWCRFPSVRLMRALLRLPW